MAGKRQNSAWPGREEWGGSPVSPRKLLPLVLSATVLEEHATDSVCSRKPNLFVAFRCVFFACLHVSPVAGCGGPCDSHLHVAWLDYAMCGAALEGCSDCSVFPRHWISILNKLYWLTVPAGSFLTPKLNVLEGPEWLPFCRAFQALLCSQSLGPVGTSGTLRREGGCHHRRAVAGGRGWPGISQNYSWWKQLLYGITAHLGSSPSPSPCTVPTQQEAPKGAGAVLCQGQGKLFWGASRASFFWRGGVPEDQMGFLEAPPAQ